MVVTFYTHSDPRITASILDDRRLGKQRVEALQIVNALQGTSRWRNHPCARMWEGYVPALKDYCNIMIEEWVRRGKVNNMAFYAVEQPVRYPDWIYSERVLFSHRARLVTKEPGFYASRLVFPEEYRYHGYIWPSKWSAEQLATLSVEELADPFVKIVICPAFTQKGVPCRNVGWFGGYCGVHRNQGPKPKKKKET